MKIKKYSNFITENNINIIFDKEWQYGNIEANIFFDINSFRKWLNQYGDFDIIDEISQYIDLPIGCIKNIKINSEFRNKGFGNKLLNIFIDECIKNDVDNVLLIADLDEEQIDGFDLVKWYKSKDFKIIGYIYDNPIMMLEI